MPQIELYAFLGAIKYMEDNQISHHYLLIQKQNEKCYFVVEEHYKKYNSVVDKCLMLGLINVYIFGVRGDDISNIQVQYYLQLFQ